jgi:hypothetical protein
MNWMGPLISGRLVPTAPTGRQLVLVRQSTGKLRFASYGAVAILFLSTTALAQSVTNDASLGHGLAGVGVLSLTDDAAERTRFPDVSGGEVVWLIETAVFVAPRIAVGIEALPLGTVTGSYDALCCTLRDQEQETAILVTGRWRALRHNRLGIDAVFGIGTVIQHRNTRTSLRFVSNSETSTIDDRYFPAVGTGVDVPFSIMRHVAISPLIRVYFLERGEQDTANVLSTPSRRVAVGATASVSW